MVEKGVSSNAFNIFRVKFVVDRRNVLLRPRIAISHPAGVGGNFQNVKVPSKDFREGLKAVSAELEILRHAEDLK